MLCSKCGAKNLDNAQFCKGCGAKIEIEIEIETEQQEEMPRCLKCGAQNEEDSAFCNKCGEKITNDFVLCPKCGIKNADDSKFCYVCGELLIPEDENKSDILTQAQNQAEEVQMIYCRKCGTQNADNSAFCNKCGAKISQGIENNIPQQQFIGQQPNMPQQPYQQNYPMYQETPKTGMVDKVLDNALGKLIGKKTERVTYDRLAQMVYEKLILPALNSQDWETMDSIRKAVNGTMFGKDVKPKDSNYELFVSKSYSSVPFVVNRDVWVFDKTTKIFYSLNKDKYYKNFKEAVLVYMH